MKSNQQIKEINENIENNILQKFSTTEKIQIQEYVSRSILATQWLTGIKGLKFKDDYTFTDLQYDKWDIELPKSKSALEVKERATIYDGSLILQEDKYNALQIARNPYYVNYTLDSNIVYVYNINDEKVINAPLILDPFNKNTTDSREDKVEKLVKYLPTEWATKCTIPNVTQFINLKCQYIDNLIKHPTKLNAILKKSTGNETL
ncbi:hypothetical protein [Dysgonomonas sp. 520]|uniref:hypothetical protein n=1 Tax=Dysgonomonas sp. 520 TaxID=2302931 RepID=UPI0013CF5D92|nr:hypothetical protein [Dysgonomonas sp. 520]NDW10679.1 hypothetical protein [Dysgonomonas sp. 520]